VQFTILQGVIPYEEGVIRYYFVVLFNPAVPTHYYLNFLFQTVNKQRCFCYLHSEVFAQAIVLVLPT